MIYLQDPDVTILQGDALELLQGLPSGSVHMACTSPPFYGLRDYGTGRWEGGAQDCDHRKDDTGSSSATSRLRLDGRAHVGPYLDEKDTRKPYGDTCGKCGATRIDQQIGLEATPDEWVTALVGVFRELRRVLRDDGSLWVEIGDSYGANTRSGLGIQDNEGFAPNSWSGKRATEHPHPYKQKDLIGAPWLLAFALRADGWYLRSEIIWAKPNPMPESVSDRPTVSHSRVFLLTKSARYFYDAEAIREDALRAGDVPGGNRQGVDEYGVNGGWAHGTVPAGRNRRSVWTIATQPYPEAHFATWPEKLVEPMILAGTSERGVCPVCGAPWERVTEQEKENVKAVTIGPKVQGYLDRDDLQRPFPQGRTGESFRWKVTTTGWQPTCTHNAEPVPATVLDPFGGSGTTALVARKHGRRAVLLELSPDYCKLAAERLSMPTELVEDQAAAARALQLSLLAGQDG